MKFILMIYPWHYRNLRFRLNTEETVKPQDVADSERGCTRYLAGMDHVVKNLYRKQSGDDSYVGIVCDHIRSPSSETLADNETRRY